MKLPQRLLNTRSIHHGTWLNLRLCMCCFIHQVSFEAGCSVCMCVCYYCPLLSQLSTVSLISGQLSCNKSEVEINPKLWVALSRGRVVVFDAASWSMLQDCIQVGESQLVRAVILYCKGYTFVYMSSECCILGNFIIMRF